VKTSDPNLSDKTVVLVVEDDSDVRHGIVLELSERFEVFEARNGQQGLSMALDLIPDIVVSDILMPIMDGVAFCRALKDKPTTSHIPFVMLTAKSSIQDQVESLECGADYYLTKPFHIELLEACIENLLRSRHLLQQQMADQIKQWDHTSTSSHPQRSFIDTALKAIHAHLTDPEFGVEQLGKALGMSPRSLQRKINAVCDVSPSQLIVEARLRHGAKLLSSTALTVLEVAMESGYRNPSHFAQTFRIHHGMNPTEYRAQNSGN